MSPELAKGIILVLLAIVVVTLFSASRMMLKKKHPDDDGSDTSFMKTLGLRVILSFATVGFIVLAVAMGWLDNT